MKSKKAKRRKEILTEELTKEKTIGENRKRKEKGERKEKGS